MNIGKRIRVKRKEIGMKQYELAKVANISNTYLSDIEVGRTNPSIKTLIRISTALKVDCSIFLDDERM